MPEGTVSCALSCPPPPRPGGRTHAAPAPATRSPSQLHGLTASPYDGNVVYWATQLGRHPELSTAWATLLKRQRGRCAHCGLYFQPQDEVIECDHVTPTALGGSQALANRQLVHGHCHDAKTAADGSDRVRLSKVGPGWNGPRRLRFGGAHVKDRK